jgi:5'-3' exonuclease
MVVLFDFDSLLYKCVYRIYSISDIKELLKVLDKENIRELIVDTALSRLENQTLRILTDIENLGVHIDPLSIEYYVTDCRDSFRKKINKDYKANRIKTKQSGVIIKWVRKIREIVKDKYNAKYSYTHEADDLIAERARELGSDNYIIVSLDKDLKQILGIHYDYYIDKKTKETRGLSVTTEHDSVYMLCYQMLTGDAGDNVKGLKNIGDKKAKKILLGKSKIGMIKSVIEKYKQLSTREHMKETYKLIKI